MSDRDDAVPTDPRADSATADPSRNAITHGLTARRPLCEEEADRLRILVDSWTSKHLPETEAEEALVQTAAVEYVRYLRCVQADERQLGPQAREALAEWREKRRHAVRRKAQDLREDPERIAAELHESAFGIDWLLGQWRRLLGLLEPGRGWTGDDLSTAMRLMGRQPRKPAEGDVDGLRLYEAAWRACPAAFDPKAQRGLVDAEAAGRLKEFVADRIERLEAVRPAAWEEVEGPQAEAVEAAAMIDTSKDGQLRQRYRREALRDMHRGISMLIRLRVERSKIDDRLVRQGRLERGSRPAGPAVGRWHDEARPSPAVVPPPPAEAGPDPAPEPQRNEPPGTEPTLAEDRRNSKGAKEVGPDPVGRSPEPGRRTEAHPGAHPGHPGGPIGGHPNPRRPEQGPRADHPMPRRDA